VIKLPRYARDKSESGVYHIMLRGINRQAIFEDDEDMQRLLETIGRYREICKYELYAYCIMNNHVHMLIKETEEAISNVVKRISGSYVFWYNKKYERCGHLFQERYKSEAVDSDEYFLTVLRYIHQNPIKAGVVKDISAYKWSSYNEYIKESEIINKDFVLEMFSNDKQKAKELFCKFNCQKSNDFCLENDDKIRVSDNELRDKFAQLGIINVSEIRQLEKSKRNDILKNLKSIEGVTIRQLSRITGLSKSVIDRI
jgi:REP element-mobilizing transposase RayT